MNKFEQRRLDLKKKFEQEMEALAEKERQETQKIVAPLAGKFAALIEEEVKKIGEEDVEKIGSYKFHKAELRRRIRDFLNAELGAEEQQGASV